MNEITPKRAGVISAWTRARAKPGRRNSQKANVTSLGRSYGEWAETGKVQFDPVNI